MCKYNIVIFDKMQTICLTIQIKNQASVDIAEGLSILHSDLTTPKITVVGQGI